MHELDMVFRPRGTRVCRVRSGSGALEVLVRDLAADPPGRFLVVVSDDSVTETLGEPLIAAIRRHGLTAAGLSLDATEARKSRLVKAELEDELLRRGAGRDAALVAVGGGVTGDLVGFVASTWHRGIPVVQVPTTLLAMVDAALGGKTAVNVGGFKNLVGSYHQPWGVYADPDVLASLPGNYYAEGFAEVVKSAVIADARLFRWLEEHRDALLARSTRELSHMIEACLVIKARVVQRDEREVGRRAVLNFGHTVAHAIETATNFDLRHGQAVSIGVCVEARLATVQTGFSARAVSRIERLLAGFGLPTRLPSKVSFEALLCGMRRDKKNRDGAIHFALPQRLGRMPPGETATLAVGEADLRRILD